ncbi:hypothetical protein [Streptomyces sp. NPDC046385]|uniref:hypothetical protein n=1 Tax=unclassified Streptomyces TaxID=2593676 RepID=UPI0033D0AEF8
MKAVVRGAAVAALVALALTGCEDGKAPAAGGAGTGVPTAGGAAAAGAGAAAASGGQSGAGTQTPPVWIDATGLFSALPTDANVGDVFVGQDPVVVQGGEGRVACTDETGTECAGFQAAGKKESVARGSADERKVEFTLFTFATPEQAGTAMKGLADRRRKRIAENGTPPKPFTLDAGADETDAFRDGDRSLVVMRIGSVVAYVDTNDSDTGNVRHVAEVQVARVNSVARGINPDR